MSRRAAAVCIVALPVLLGGCHSAAQLTGLATGAVAGVATASPAVGYLVGVSTAVAADEAFKWYGRSRSHAEQQAIADSPPRCRRAAPRRGTSTTSSRSAMSTARCGWYG